MNLFTIVKINKIGETKRFVTRKFTFTSSNLKQLKRTHAGEKPHRCTMCELSGISTKQLDVHMMSQHTREKPFKCNQCNYGELQRHMKTHTGEKSFRCNKCNKALRTKGKSHKTFQNSHYLNSDCNILEDFEIHNTALFIIISETSKRKEKHLKTLK